MLPYFIRFLHILSASLWLGAALFWPGALRRALGAAPPQLEAALRQARAALGLDLAAGIATVAFGTALFWKQGANEVLVAAAGLTLALARLGLLLGIARPALARVEQAVGAGDVDRARAIARRVPAYAGAAHLLWLVALGAMVFPM
jgi:hypothetical protein